MRFLVQWIASERARKSVIPVAFWFFSIGGGILLLIYALYRRDPVFIAGQALGLAGLFPQSVFHHRQRTAVIGEGLSDAPDAGRLPVGPTKIAKTTPCTVSNPMESIVFRPRSVATSKV